MSKPATTPEKPKESDPLERKLKLAKGALGISQSALTGSAEKAFHQALVPGLKMASEGVFKDPLANPLHLTRALKKLGIAVLAWTPETLAATIDEKFNGWDKTKVSDALTSFHKTGVIKSDIPQLVREKIYAIRVIATSNSAQTEWHIFEKVGGAFNDRAAKFGIVEPLSAAECARTVAIIENIRPDSYTDEVKIYIAVCCHQAGLLTVSPVNWLSHCDPYLQELNRQATGDTLSAEMREKISAKYAETLSNTSSAKEVPDEVIAVQAAKLAAIHLYAEEILR